MENKLSIKLKRTLMAASAVGAVLSLGLQIPSAEAATYYTADQSNSTTSKVGLDKKYLTNSTLSRPELLRPGSNEFTYAAVVFTPLKTETLVFGQTNSPTDTVMILYSNVYDPDNPGNGAITGNDDVNNSKHREILGNDALMTQCGPSVNYCPMIKADVQAGVTYTLWVSVYSGGYNTNFEFPFGFYSSGDVVFGTYNQGKSPIDLVKPFYLSSELNVTVDPRFVGGVLRMDQSGTYSDDFELANMASNTIDAFGNNSVFSGTLHNAAGQDGIISIDDSVGNGKVKFTGTNTYTGATQLKGGELSVERDANLGGTQAKVIFEGGTLHTTASFASLREYEIRQTNKTNIINTDNNTTLQINNIVSGDGVWHKKGAGTLALNAQNTYSGTLSVDDGTLAIGNTSNLSAAKLAGDVAVQYGATLTGFGRVGGNLTLNRGSVFTPGNENITTNFNIGGNLTMQGATLNYKTFEDGKSDQVTVGGSATIHDSALAISSGPGLWQQKREYVVINTQNGVTGNFSQVDTNLTFLTPVVHNDGNKIILTLERNDTDFLDPSEPVNPPVYYKYTYNQRNTARALDSLSSAHDLDWAMAQLTVATAIEGFDNISGEIYGSTRSALMTNSRYLRDAVNRHLLDNKSEPVWFSSWGHGGRISGDNNAARTNNNGWGLALGLDGQVNDNVRAGVILGYERSDIGNQRNSSSDVDAMHFGGYIGAEYGGLKLRGGAAYSYLDMSTSRKLWVFGPQTKAKDNYDGWQVQLFGEGSYDFQLGQNATISPYVNLAHVWLDGGDVRENYARGAGLTVKGNTDSATFTTLGMRGEYMLPGQVIAVYADAGWQHGFGDINGKTRNRFRNAGNSFSIKGVGVAEDIGLVGTGFTAKVNENNSITLGYQGQYGDDLNDHSANAQWQIKF